MPLCSAIKRNNQTDFQWTITDRWTATPSQPLKVINRGAKWCRYLEVMNRIHCESVMSIDLLLTAHLPLQRSLECETRYKCRLRGGHEAFKWISPKHSTDWIMVERARYQSSRVFHFPKARMLRDRLLTLFLPPSHNYRCHQPQIPFRTHRQSSPNRPSSNYNFKHISLISFFSYYLLSRSRCHSHYLIYSEKKNNNLNFYWLIARNCRFWLLFSWSHWRA